MTCFWNDISSFRRVSGPGWDYYDTLFYLSQAGSLLSALEAGIKWYSNCLSRQPPRKRGLGLVGPGQCGKGKRSHKSQRVTGRQEQGPGQTRGSKRSRGNRLKARPHQGSLAKISFYSARLGWSAGARAVCI